MIDYHWTVGFIGQQADTFAFLDRRWIRIGFWNAVEVEAYYPTLRHTRIINASHLASCSQP
jgi:lipopolysaccharide biosynthesis protein